MTQCQRLYIFVAGRKLNKFHALRNTKVPRNDLAALNPLNVGYRTNSLDAVPEEKGQIEDRDR